MPLNEAAEPFFVFLSYASPNVDVARDVAVALQESGVRCFFAPRDIGSGGNYGKEIVRALNRCDALLLLLSEHSLRSGFVRREVTLAIESDKDLRPFALGDFEFARDVAIDDQWVFWLSGVQIVKYVDTAQVVAVVRSAASATAAPVTSAEVAPPAEPPPVGFDTADAAIDGLLRQLRPVADEMWHELDGRHHVLLEAMSRKLGDTRSRAARGDDGLLSRRALDHVCAVVLDSALDRARIAYWARHEDGDDAIITTADVCEAEAKVSELTGRMRGVLAATIAAIQEVRPSIVGAVVTWAQQRVNDLRKEPGAELVAVSWLLTLANQVRYER